MGLHANYKVSSNVTLTARVENLFDTDYTFASFGSGLNQETFPGRGRGIFAGVTFEW